MATKRKAAKKAPLKRAKAAPQPLGYASSNFPSHHPDIKSGMLAATDAAMADSASADEERPISFSVADGSTYEHLRVTLDYSEVVIYDDKNVPSKPRENGALISVLIEMIGSPGNKVTLNVQNAVPAQLDCSIASGTSYSKTQILKAKW